MAKLPDFIATIEAKGNNGLVFSGTGFLVSPQFLLTCAHVVVGMDSAAYARWLEENKPEYDDVRVRFIDEPDSSFHLGTVVAYGDPDIALIRLKQRVSRSPLRLIARVHSYYEDAITHQGLVAGFAGANQNSLAEYSIEEIWDSSRVFGTPKLLDIQLKGGRAKGMSGGPALVDVAGQWACFGMIYLGGEGAATSRLILSDTLLGVLEREQVDFAICLDAGECFTWTLGGFIAKQRESRRLSRQDLAYDLGIPKAILRDWERGLRTPADEYRALLHDLLVRGDARLDEEWRELLAKSPAPGVDIPARLGQSAAGNALMVVRASDVRRGLGAGRKRRQRVRLEAGSEAKILIDLPWEGYATFLDVERLESVERLYTLLDPLLGSGKLSAGRSVLPGTHTIPVGGPSGRYCLIALARPSIPFEWDQGDGTEPVPLPLQTVLPVVQPFFEPAGVDSFVALCAYDVWEAADSWNPTPATGTGKER